MEKEVEQLKEICNLIGVSGFENQVAKYLINEYTKLGLPIVKDNIGSLAAVKKSSNKDAKKVMLIAHMDEVGFMVNQILPNGNVKVIPLGGINPTILPSSRVTLFNNANEAIKGMINSLPPHLLGAEKEVSKVIDYEFNFGFSSKEEAKKKISIGNVIVMDGPFETINDDTMFLSKALDDRAGTSAILSIAKMINDKSFDYDIYFAHSVQEEVGCRGAKTLAYKIQPDVAIVIDVSPTREDMGKLGAGVVIRHHDSNMIPFTKMMNLQKEVLAKNNIPTQDYISLGGTDAGNVHQNMDGVVTLTNCLLATSIHSPSSLMAKCDYLNLIKSLDCLLLSLNSEKIVSLKDKYER